MRKPGDEARASVHVAVEPAVAFEVFTSEIDRWWRRGPKFRVAGDAPGALSFEAGAGGRLFERYETANGPRLFERGRVLIWEPPRRLVFEWRLPNFEPHEKTEVEISFTGQGDGTLVTVAHRGWASIRPDHPARHGQPVVEFIGSMGMWWPTCWWPFAKRSWTGTEPRMLHSLEICVRICSSRSESFSSNPFFEG